jgi:futalosine hydrolase
MKILLVSATYKEVEGVFKTLDTANCLEKNFFRGYAGENLVDIIVNGVGATATGVILERRISFSRYDLVLNIGICGSFRRDLEKGKVVTIVSEIWGDLGVEDHEEFLDLFDLKMLIEDESPFKGRKLINKGNAYSQYLSHLPGVKGITVNKAHGNLESIAKCVEKYNPDVESMESAAIFSVCLSHGINFYCLRSISNFVEPRNRADWEIEKALENLTTEVNKFIRVVQ